MNVKELKNIGYLFFISCIFVMLGFITINYTFSNVNDSNDNNWNVYIDNVTLKDNYNINNTLLNFNVDMDINKDYSFTFIIANSSNYDAYLKSIYSTVMNDVLIGISPVTGNAYYLNDYVDFYMTYLEDNNYLLSSSDILERDSYKDVRFTFKVKKLDEDKLIVLNENRLKFDFSIDLDYQQKI